MIRTDPVDQIMIYQIMMYRIMMYQIMMYQIMMYQIMMYQIIMYRIIKGGEVMEFGPKVLAICDWEEGFGVGLMEYIQGKKRITMDIHVFTEVETLRRYAEKKHINLLLISDRLMSDVVRELSIERVLILSEGFCQEKYDDFSYVYKYQPADNILQEIFRAAGAGDHLAEGERIWKKRKSILGICSPAGCGSSMLFAIAMGRNLARRFRVLYMDLESISGFEELTGIHSEQNFSDLIYMFRRTGAEAVRKLGDMICSAGDMDYLAPVRSPEDFFNMSQEEIKELLRLIMEESDYEIVILDLDADMPYMTAMAELADKIFLITENDSPARAKTARFRKLMQRGNLRLLQEKEVIVELPPVRMQREGRGVFDEIRRSGIGEAAEKYV